MSDRDCPSEVILVQFSPCRDGTLRPREGQLAASSPPAAVTQSWSWDSVSSHHPGLPHCAWNGGEWGDGRQKEGGWRANGKLFAKAVVRGSGGEEHFTRPRASGLETSVSLQISEGTLASPSMPKSCGGRGRAGVGPETSNAFPCTLGDLLLTRASGALSLLLPPVRSVRSSQRQLTSQFHSLTPAARGPGGLGWDQQQLPLHLLSSDLHQDN